MKESIRQRLQKLSDRFEEVGRLLATTRWRGCAAVRRTVHGQQSAHLLEAVGQFLQALADGSSWLRLQGAAFSGMSAVW